jgi:hypothetical protein
MALPENYRSALRDSVPEGRACGNCGFFDESRQEGDEAWCERWDDWARGDMYCNAWKRRGRERDMDEMGEMGEDEDEDLSGLATRLRETM